METIQIISLVGMILTVAIMLTAIYSIAKPHDFSQEA